MKYSISTSRLYSIQSILFTIGQGRSTEKGDSLYYRSKKPTLVSTKHGGGTRLAYAVQEREACKHFIFAITTINTSYQKYNIQRNYASLPKKIRRIITDPCSSCSCSRRGTELSDICLLRSTSEGTRQNCKN